MGACAQEEGAGSAGRPAGSPASVGTPGGPEGEAGLAGRDTRSGGRVARGGSVQAHGGPRGPGSGWVPGHTWPHVSRRSWSQCCAESWSRLLAEGHWRVQAQASRTHEPRTAGGTGQPEATTRRRYKNAFRNVSLARAFSAYLFIFWGAGRGEVWGCQMFKTLGKPTWEQLLGIFKRGSAKMHNDETCVAVKETCSKRRVCRRPCPRKHAWAGEG